MQRKKASALQQELMKQLDYYMQSRSSRRVRLDWAVTFAGCLAFLASVSWGQTMYKSVSPDGKVTYSDKPPVAAQGTVQEIPRARPAAVPAPVPGQIVTPAPLGPGVAIVPGVMPAPPGEIVGALRESKEMNDSRECQRANLAAISLRNSAEGVIRIVNNIKISKARGSSANYDAIYEKQLSSAWDYYKSRGGTAASPEHVTLPEDPCKEVRAALQRKGAAMEAQYRECTTSHAKELKLAILSKQLVANRGYLVALEKVQAEQRKNPNVNSDNKGSAEWAASFKTDPALVRATLASQFQEYRSLGGPASRLEDVGEVPNPCLTEVSKGESRASASGSSPITARRTLTLPGR